MCQQGGVFSCGPKRSDYNTLLYNAALKNVFSLNILTRVCWPGNVKLIERVNHILDIGRDYKEIRSGYNRNTLRNIRHAIKLGVTIEYENNPDMVVSFLAANDQSGSIHRYTSEIRELIKSSFDTLKGFAIKASIDDKIHSIAFFIEDNDRLYFLLCASDPIGKANKSMYLMIDRVIISYARKKNIFDFTGSNIENIARRNISFGAKTETYYQLKWNRLQLLYS